MEIVKTQPRKIFGNRGAKPKYPFREMQPGQSLVIHNADRRMMQNIRSAMHQFLLNNQLDWKVTSEKDGTSYYIHRIS